MILAGDIGGTNSRLALFDERLKRLWNRTWSSRAEASLADIVRQARRAIDGPIHAASFGIAGVVLAGKAQATNLPWTVDAEKIAGVLDLEHVGLLNDLEAHAWSIGALDATDWTVLIEGAPDARGNAALIAAGTGLGEAGLFWDGSGHVPFACEGGHASFAPADERELELWRWLHGRYGHVSFERILSGPGLVDVHAFLGAHGLGREPSGLFDAGSPGDRAAAITQAAFAGNSERAAMALEMFARIYGAEAGNLALKHMATGGVWVGGGIGPKIAPVLATAAFREAFVGKGRMRALLERIPVRLIWNDQTALLGAARHASATCGSVARA